MKSALVVLAVVMTVTLAQECGMLQRIKVKQQWASAYGAAAAREDFGEAIWKALVFKNQVKTLKNITSVFNLFFNF